MSDSYKVSHYKQYPVNTEYVYSYFESRGGKYDAVTFFGLQYFLKRYLSGAVITREKIDQAAEYYNAHFMDPSGGMFNKAGWEYILETHGGTLPVEIKAVPEGMVVPTKNVLFTMVNTDPKCFWLTNFLETLLVQVWYPMTVATHSGSMKRVIIEYLEKTGDPEGISFKLHDFGFRGVSSVETAGIGGAAHLVNFLGTDTVAGMIVAKEVYGAAVVSTPHPVLPFPTQCPGYSIPASEHSTITSWGKENETAAMENMLDQYPVGLVACVSDSYDIFKACTEKWGTELKAKVLARPGPTGEGAGTLVVRPDSGDPVETSLKVVELLWDAFGGETNAKGFKVLDPHVRIIWGDGIDRESLEDILSSYASRGWSADNIAFGSGGGLLQKLNRDTQKCAFKCSEITVAGAARDVFKDPITDPGKKSKRGRLSLHCTEGIWETRMGADVDPATDILVGVFRNGSILKEYTFEEIREKAWPSS
jgi:nicotinamide phosphoribosyltransferase